MKYSRRIELAVCFIYLLISISGCGKQGEVTEKPHSDNKSVQTKEEKQNHEVLVSAKDIIKAFNEHGYNNYRQKIVYVSRIEMGEGDQKMVIPSTVTVESDRIENNIYEVQAMEVEHPDLELDYYDETYMIINPNEIVYYSSMLNQNNWYKGITTNQQEARLLNLSEEDFAKAECSFDQENETYTVKVPLKDLSKTRDFYLCSLQSGQVDVSRDTPSELDSAIEEGNYQAVFIFSASDMKLLSIDYDDVEYSYVISGDSNDSRINCSGSMKVTFSDYGNVERDRVDVSEKIMKEAEPLT